MATTVTKGIQYDSNNNPYVEVYAETVERYGVDITNWLQSGDNIDSADCSVSIEPSTATADTLTYDASNKIVSCEVSGFTGGYVYNLVITWVTSTGRADSQDIKLICKVR